MSFVGTLSFFLGGGGGSGDGGGGGVGDGGSPFSALVLSFLCLEAAPLQ